MARAARPKHDYTPYGKRPVFAVIGLAAIAVANAAHGVLYAWWLHRWDEIEDWQAYEVAEQWVADTSTVAFLLTAIVFTVWFWRAYRNATALGMRGRFSQPWAILGWGVPIASLFVPVLMVSDMWRHAARERVGSFAAVGLWWTGFLVGPALQAIGEMKFSTTASEAQTWVGMQTVIASCAVSATTAVLAILITRRLTAAHEAMRSVHQAEVFD